MEHQRKYICLCWLARGYRSLQQLHGWSGQDGLSYLLLPFGVPNEKMANKSHSSSSFNESCQRMDWIQGTGSRSGQQKEERHGFVILLGIRRGSTMQTWDKSKATYQPIQFSKTAKLLSGSEEENKTSSLAKPWVLIWWFRSLATTQWFCDPTSMQDGEM